VKFLKVPVHFAAFIQKLIPVPFGIFIINTDIISGWPPCRYRIDAPMDEYPEF